MVVPQILSKTVSVVLSGYEVNTVLKVFEINPLSKKFEVEQEERKRCFRLMSMDRVGSV